MDYTDSVAVDDSNVIRIQPSCSRRPTLEINKDSVNLELQKIPKMVAAPMVRYSKWVLSLPLGYVLEVSKLYSGLVIRIIVLGCLSVSSYGSTLLMLCLPRWSTQKILLLQRSAVTQNSQRVKVGLFFICCNTDFFSYYRAFIGICSYLSGQKTAQYFVYFTVFKIIVVGNLLTERLKIILEKKI